MPEDLWTPVILTMDEAAEQRWLTYTRADWMAARRRTGLKLRRDT
jgi:hypothetical protein